MIHTISYLCIGTYLFISIINRLIFEGNRNKLLFHAGSQIKRTTLHTHRKLQVDTNANNNEIWRLHFLESISKSAHIIAIN